MILAECNNNLEYVLAGGSIFVLAIIAITILLIVIQILKDW
jgi:hypothetical protein